MRIRHAAARAALTVVALAAAAVPAAGHTEVSGTQPGAGAELSHPPQMVLVRYAEAVQSVRDARVVVGGRQLAGPARVSPGDARTVVIPVDSDGAPAGAWRATWTVVAADGDAVAGEVSFRVRPPAGAAAVRRLGRTMVTAARAVEAAVADER